MATPVMTSVAIHSHQQARQRVYAKALARRQAHVTACRRMHTAAIRSQAAQAFTSRER